MARSGRNFKAPRPMERPDKNMFEEFAKDYGCSVTVERVDVGKWNERREFKVNGEVVGMTFKGDRTDWYDLMRGVAEASGDANAVGEVNYMKGKF